MKKIEFEIKRQYIIFGLCMSMFIIINAFLINDYITRYSEYISDYTKINNIQLSYNESRTYFHLYNKELEEDILKKYRESMLTSYAILADIETKVTEDRQANMMYRIVSQMLRHRDAVIEDYISPIQGMAKHGIDYIEDLDLLIETNINHLTASYLDYISSDYKDHLKHFQSNMVIMYIMLIGGSGFVFWLNTFLYTRILLSLKELGIAAETINQKNFDAEDIPAGKYQEFNLVITAFNAMKHTIKDMLEELNQNFVIRESLSEQMLVNEQQKRHLAEAKMRELQLQINPHFLFNTLSLVIRSIQRGDKENSLILIQSISKILRSSIEINALSIPLDDEIDLLESYLFIQRLHCRGRIRLHLDIRKSYMEEDIMVPPLIIQPLVENAIKHGMRDITGNGEVNISIVEASDYIRVDVYDNGCGMSRETLATLKGSTEIASLDRLGIGLLNVKDRLRLLYGRDDVMTIESDATGTRIQLLLFKDRNKDGGKNDSIDIGR